MTFDNSITGVVGPNGCGKSNIVDAIQWVMGEQSAKHLRGDSMTDVIFNGSEHKQALSMAEVSLVMERDGMILAPQFAAFEKSEEISITRRVYRDGTGEYLINKTPCRLKDIHELFMDTGVGKRAYSIIEQGQIDRMINVKPEERRNLFEEVAGITKYKAKRKEAERKLEATKQNMVRLDDIVQELEKQIRSLKIQATRARKYREIKSELEAIDLYLLGKNLFTHKRNIEAIEEKQQHLVNERSQSDAEFSRIDTEVTELEIKRIEQEKGYQELSEKEKATLLLIQKLENDLSLLVQRREHITETYEKNKAEEHELGLEINELSASMEREAEEKEKLGAELAVLEETARELEETARREETAREELRHRKENLQHKKVEYSQRLATLEQQHAHATERERENTEIRAALNQKLSDSVVAIEGLKETLKKAEEEIAECAARAEQSEKEVANLHTECQELSSRLSQVEENLYQARENFYAQKSRLESLKELQENLEGYSPTAREILKQLEGGVLTAIPLAEVIQPEADIEDHLELLLGLDMNTLLVQTENEAERLSRLVNIKDLERVRILSTDQMTSHPSEEAPAGSVSLLDKIKIKPGYETAVEWWMGNTYLCDDLDNLMRLRKQHPEYTFLSKADKTIGHSDRSLSAGKQPTKMGVFARRREIEDLEKVCAGLETDLAAQAAERESILSQLQTSEKMHLEQKDRLSSVHIESVEHRKEREKVQIELNRADRDYTSLQHESERNLKQIEDAREQAERILQDKTNVTAATEALVTDLAQLEEKMAQAAKGHEALVQTIHEKRIERSRLGERVNSLEYKFQKLESELELATSNREDLKNAITEAETEIAKIEEKNIEVKGQREVAEKDRDRVVVDLSDMKTAFNETSHSLQALRDQKSELQKRRDAVLAEIQELEIKITHERSHYEHLVGISNERYQKEPTLLDENVGIDLVLLPMFTEQLTVEWMPLSDTDKRGLLDEHLKNLKEKITRYGEVNLTAIQEFEEIQKRYDFLMEQKQDLERSIGILQDAIVRIEETTKIRFEETFEAVNKKFKEIFPILFNGGKAELTLLQPELDLEGKPKGEQGVDIMASPPGKRLQSITLLSGGEKALTAVSLVLAIFARKPSPFCLLDEVDAPLDDANVSRFNTVIKKMSEKTQFIVITHNKKTMEIAEALYGVTMERAGISKMSSVRLS